jgi:hypothetical protein
MKKYRVVLLCITILLLISLFTTPITRAALDAFELNWWTVDSGGGQTSGGVFNLQGVSGQPDADSSQGGDFSLASGYLGGASLQPPTQHRLFLPLVIKP